ncbi:MAG: hypothetical protein KAR39_12170 [Thermoplasmata archaeon]|nr:hypothetical protein [Thermoplasmata archaeon]
MDPVLTGIATGVIVKGAKFLYGQAKNFLSAWRERRRNPDAPLADVLEPPKEVTLGDARPLSEPIDEAMVVAIEGLKKLVKRVTDEKVDSDSPEARAAVADLRELLEIALRSPITFAGEAPRSLDVSDIDVRVKKVAGRVAIVRSNLEKLENIKVKRIRIDADDVEESGDLTVVDLK